MALKRIILEMGHGNDIHGGDYTKAALRAVQDCIHHSSLAFLRTLKIDAAELDIEVTIGVQKPELVDAAKVIASLPVGKARVKVVKGGLDVPDDEGGGASATAIQAMLRRTIKIILRNTKRYGGQQFVDARPKPLGKANRWLPAKLRLRQTNIRLSLSRIICHFG